MKQDLTTIRYGPIDSTNRRRKRAPTLTFRSLRSCSNRDGAAHGFYASISDSVLTSVLALAQASPLFFALFVHAGHTVSVLSQWAGASPTIRRRVPNTVLGICCAVQGACLVALAAILQFSTLEGFSLAVATFCLTILGAMAGNIAGPVWHGVWAAALTHDLRRETLFRRSHFMNGASLAALVVTVSVLGNMGSRSAFAFLLSLAGAAKLSSSFYIRTRLPFDSRTTKNDGAVQLEPGRGTISAEAKLRIISLVPFFVALGASSSLITPYLSQVHGLDPKTIVQLTSLGLCGQFLFSTTTKRRFGRANPELLLGSAMAGLALLPFAFIIAEGFLSWAIVMVASGFASAAWALGLQYEVHQAQDADEVARTQAALNMYALCATGAGGFIAATVFYLSEGVGTNHYFWTFGLTALCRLLAIVFFIAARSKHSPVTASA